MDLSLDLGRLDKLYHSYKNNNNKMDPRVAYMYAIKKSMERPFEERMNILGNYALDFKNYQKKFISDVDFYTKYLDIIPMHNPPIPKLDYVRKLNGNSNIAKKLISLRVLDDMNIFVKEKNREKDIYDLALDGYLIRDNSPERSLSIAVSDILRRSECYDDKEAYDILGEAYLEAILLTKKVENGEYQDLYPFVENYYPNFASLPEVDKMSRFEEIIHEELYDNGLTFISEKIVEDFFDIGVLRDKIDEYYNM